jgi:hypothetical protein
MSIPADKVAAWKIQYKRVFSVQAGKGQYAFRALTIHEWEEIVKHAEWSSADAEDHIIDLALLWPEDFDLDSVPPGIVTTVAEEITEVSGFNNVHSVIHALNQAREDLDYLGMAKAFIIAAMPAYTYDDLGEKTVPDLMELVAASEQILRLQALAMGAEVREPVRLVIRTPEEIEEEMNQKLDEGTAKKNDAIAQKLHQAMMQEGMG